MIPPPEIRQRLIFGAADRGRVPELQKWNGKRRRDLLRRWLELERIGFEHLAPLEHRIDKQACPRRIHNRALDDGNVAQTGIGARDEFEAKYLTQLEHGSSGP